MEKLLKLRNDIARHQAIYYNGGDAPVDDATYDSWVRDLKKLSPDDPLLKAVGAPVPADSALQKVQHKHHMGSLNNAMTEDEFSDWYQGVYDKLSALVALPASHGQAMPHAPKLSVSFKMDGASAELVYENGELVQASTRGDGEIGEDITANVLRMQGVPRFVWWPVPPQMTVQRSFTGFVRGEIMLFNEEWKKLDPDQLSNPRNLGNGMARRKDGEGCENLHFVAFRGFGSDGEPLGTSEMEMLSTLRSLGFDTVVSWSQLCVDKVRRLYAFAQGEAPKADDNYVAYRQEICRDKLPFEIDGLVVKLEDFKLQELLGEANNRPKGQIAFKFPPRGAKTKLLDVEWTVGHTGVLAPVAVLAPVRVGGVTVSRASLYNMEEIERLGLWKGCTVEIVRSGDVIPIVTKVLD